MRLLDVRDLTISQYPDSDRPPYVIASHRWGKPEEEPTFKDIEERCNTEKAGYKKVEKFAEYVNNKVPGVDHLWVDTCCINKEDVEELPESINLMFEWYRDAELCVAYLADVNGTEDKESFAHSVWHTRGWTLQELLAPRTVVFLTKEWETIGHKGDLSHNNIVTSLSLNLEKELEAITGIPERVLHDYRTSIGISDVEKLNWMNGRQTTKEEDKSYALLGIFGVTLHVNYGEKYQGARNSLMKAVREKHELPDKQMEKFRNIMAPLAPPDPWANHESARQRHEPQTGTWLLQSEKYQSWKTGTTRHLWVNGQPGCGKTVLCSTAIEDVRAHCGGASNIGYAIFYFTFTDKQKQSYGYFLKSLLAQLARRDPGFSLLEQLQGEDNQRMQRLGELEKIVLSSIRAYEQIYLLVDGMDECPVGESRSGVLNYLERLSNDALQLRIFATSRTTSDISDLMKVVGSSTIFAEVRCVDPDIRRYVSNQLSHDRSLRQLRPACRALIEEELPRKADGMFRWAYCQLEELRTLQSTKPAHVKAVLDTLPVGLDATYERVLCGIKPMLRLDALTLLRWLAYARAPLTLAELAEATIIDVAACFVREEERGMFEDTLNILTSLVMVQEDLTDEEVEQYEIWDIAGSESPSQPYHEPSNGKKRKANSSMEDGPDSEDFGRDEQMDCATSVVSDQPDSGTSRGSNSRHSEQQETVVESQLATSELPYGLGNSMVIWYRGQALTKKTRLRLAHYSVKEFLESKRILRGEAREFFLEAAIGHRWLNQSCLTYLSHYSRSGKKTKKWLDFAMFPLLWYAARSWSYHSGLQQSNDVSLETSLLLSEEALRDWLRVYHPDYDKFQEPFDGMEESYPEVAGLYLASCMGLERVVEGLLLKDADPDDSEGLHGGALQVASYRGHEKVVKLLIDAEADVDARPTRGDYANPLQVARAYKHEAIVQMLLDAGADPKDPQVAFGRMLDRQNRALWAAEAKKEGSDEQDDSGIL